MNLLRKLEYIKIDLIYRYHLNIVIDVAVDVAVKIAVGELQQCKEHDGSLLAVTKSPMKTNCRLNFVSARFLACDDRLQLS